MSLPAAAPGPNLAKLLTLGRNDGWSNQLTGLGVSGADRRVQSMPTLDNRPVDFLSLELLWRSDDMAARIIETPADELIRKFPKVKIGDDKEQGDEIDDALEDLKAQERFRLALQYQRAYGGGAILIGLNDRTDIAGLKLPVDETRILSVDYLTVFSPRECQVYEWQNNPLKADYGEPLMYQVTPMGLVGPEGSPGLTEPFLVHTSRIVRFNGPVTSRLNMQNRNYGWGDSILSRVSEIIRDFQMTWDASAYLVSDFSQAVFKMQGLADAIAGDAEGLVMKRVAMMDYSRSQVRSIIIDAENEEFSRETTPMSGLPETLDRWSYRLAAGARMPVSLIMGKQPSGLNATGEVDVRWFYDQLASQQQNELSPALEMVVRYLFLAKNGPTGGKEPDSWTLDFPPLWQMDEQAMADIYFKTAQADGQYLDRGVVLPDEVAQSRFGGDIFGDRIQLDEELRSSVKVPKLAPAAQPLPKPAPGAGNPGGSKGRNSPSAK